MIGARSGFFQLVASHRLGGFLLALLVLLPVFLAPRWPLPGTTFAYLFIVDVSESMNVRDVPGGGADESRLDRAKRSNLTTVTTSPCLRAFISLANSGLPLVDLPEAFSL